MNTDNAQTWNNAKSLGTTKDARLDFFVKTVRGIQTDQLFDLFEKSWLIDKLDTLKILFYGRDCRGGKGEKDLFIQIFKHSINNPQNNIYSKHFMANMELIADYGYYKDYLNIFIDTQYEDNMLQFLCNLLIDDFKKMRLDPYNLSLCVKYMPTQNTHYDKNNPHLIPKIVKYLNIPNDDINQAKKIYRKKYLTPMRKHLKIVEEMMCSRQWENIQYEQVPSVAMKRYNEAFKRNDQERFNQYLDQLKQGTSKINVKQLYPHDIVSSYISSGSTEINDVIEQQWKQKVQEIREYGKLKQTLCVCDVSGSMFTQNNLPIRVCVSLGILISQVLDQPWTNYVMTFSETPKFIHLPTDNLRNAISSLIQSNWQMNTNFQAVFKLILSEARARNLSQQDMPKKVIVFSDMQFDQAENEQKTNFESVSEMYAKYNYTIPQLIFWNLNGSTSDFPVSKDQKNVALISGFSPSILKQFLNDEEITPYSIMRSCIDNKRYSPIKLAD